MPKYREPKPKENPIKNIHQHLIQKLLNQQQGSQKKVQDQSEPCKYGVSCAHLRTQGECHFLHTRNHYLFLNLVPPNSCLEQPEEEENKLSKKQRKDKKILEKTINEQINVTELKQKEAELKHQRQQELHKQLMNKIDQKQRKVIEIVSCTNVSDLFAKLNILMAQFPNICEIKRRAMMQLRKKNDALYKQTVDKQYRIASRLIKASKKNTDLSLLQLYNDINHDSVPSIREYFLNYLNEETGIPYTLQNQSQPKDKLHLTTILNNLFFIKPEEYSSDFYLTHVSQENISQILSNIEFYNLMVPFAVYKKQQYNKFYYINCEESLSLDKISELLTQDHLITFHAKCKNPPQYPFGQLQSNVQKFKHWAAKISSKFNEHQISHKIVFVLDNIEALLAEDLQQFQLQKLRERQETLKALIATFTSVTLIFLSHSKKLQTVKSRITDLLKPSPEATLEIETLHFK